MAHRLRQGMTLSDVDLLEDEIEIAGRDREPLARRRERRFGTSRPDRADRNHAGLGDQEHHRRNGCRSMEQPPPAVAEPAGTACLDASNHGSSHPLYELFSAGAPPPPPRPPEGGGGGEKARLP